jgi:hypothetical protein
MRGLKTESSQRREQGCLPGQPDEHQFIADPPGYGHFDFSESFQAIEVRRARQSSACVKGREIVPAPGGPAEVGRA